MTDLEERLKKMIKDATEVNSVDTGMKIGVMIPTLFPWYQGIDQLIETGQEVWVNKSGDQIYVQFKPEKISPHSCPAFKRFLLFHRQKL